MDTFAHLIAGLTAALSLQNLDVRAYRLHAWHADRRVARARACRRHRDLIPLTFKLDPTGAIIMLSAIYYGAMYGGR